MNLYKEINNPSPEDIRAAIENWSYFDAICQSIDAYRDGAGESAVFDKLYKKSVKRGKERRKEDEASGLELKTAEEYTREAWRDLMRPLVLEHPIHIVSLMCMGNFDMHRELCDKEARLLAHFDGHAGTGKYKETTLLIVRLSAYFLTTNKECAEALLDSWRKEVNKTRSNRTRQERYLSHTKERKPFFALLEDFFDFALAQDHIVKNEAETVFSFFMYERKATNAFFPNVPIEIYRRYYDQ